MKQQLTLPEKFNLNTIPIGNAMTWDLDQETPWVQEFLIELSENSPSENPAAANAKISIKAKLQKENHAQWGTYLTMVCEVNATFPTACVKTLAPMEDQLNFEFNAIFIDESLEKDSYFDEQTETYINGKMWELYFFQNNTAQLKDVIHEHIFLNLNYFPSIAGEE